MSRITRRTFVKAAAASTLFPTFTVAGTKSSGKVLGANEVVRVGVAGINGRGQSHMDGFGKLENVQVTYLIDPDSRLFGSRSRKVKQIGGNTPQTVQDIRKALDDPNLDAVSVATPNHWHSLISIWACQAGKDVYVEKPLSHNIFEGRKLAEAAEKYGRMVQHGTQSRSSTGIANEIAAVQSGKYGKLLVSKGYCCKPRWSIGFKPVEAPPPELDFNIWLGPAKERPYNGNLVHYNWHWFWETGNGDVGNQGVHQMDIARWAIKGATLPKSVWSLGGRFGYEDQGETPNTLLSVYDYGDALLVFETRGLVGKFGQSAKIDNEFYTTEGMIADGKFHPKDGGQPEKLDSFEINVTPGGAFGSFIQAVRSRNAQELNADALTGHYSSALCHLGNISYRLGETVPFNKASKSLGDNQQVVESFMNIRENLQAVAVKLEETNYRLGPLLAFDAETERFTDDAANDLLTREYRAPFIVPEKV